jgi:8-oxo-dGTP diphosphatase
LPSCGCASNEWVLPKGKLNEGETPRGAAEREVLEETGHDVEVHEFIGTLVYDAGGRSKVVHYWRMETRGGQVYDLMNDIRSVDWLPLDQAVARLSREHERAFLANVGPLALQAVTSGRDRAKRPVADRKRRRLSAAPPPAAKAPLPNPPQADPASAPDAQPIVASEIVAVETSDHELEIETAPRSIEADTVAAVMSAETDSGERAGMDRGRRLVEKVWDWLRRAA